MTTYFSEWFKVEPADPAGYWLIPQKSSDPNEWALMELPNPVDEIARLAAENRALRECEDDIRTVVGFVLGWWPGYEDAVEWDDDIDKEDHGFYMAAERLRCVYPAAPDEEE